jgi:hypothetical protein
MRGGEGVKNKRDRLDRPRVYQWINGKRIRRRELEYAGD